MLRRSWRNWDARKEYRFEVESKRASLFLECVTQLHGPCGAVIGADENGGLDRFGELEADPQRIKRP
jgi:hypothetical protein